MLHLETIDSTLLDVAVELMSIPSLDSFRIVGGTAAALQLGHRVSVDIDLFSNDKINEKHVINTLQRQFASAKIYNDYDWITAYVKGIKIDIHSDWHTPFSDAPMVQNGLRLATLRDVAILKVNAITDRREKKDYIDLYYLFKAIDAAQLLCDFKKVEPLLSDKSIVFALGEASNAFANQSPMPEMRAPLNENDIILMMNNIRSDYLKSIEKQRNQPPSLNNEKS